MLHLRHVLKDCRLFSGYSEDAIHLLLRQLKHRIATFDKGQPIAIEGAICSHVGIVLRGQVQVQKVLESGKVVALASLGRGEVFAEAVMFSEERRYPATLSASSAETTVLFIGREEVLRLCREDALFLRNYLGLLSGKILELNQRIKEISYQSIRQKVASFLLRESKSHGEAAFELGVNRREMADRLGIPRPSLSRELVQLKEEGWLDFDGRNVTLHRPDLLEACLLE